MVSPCSGDHAFREISRRRVRETVEDVIYVTQTIKKFNREGAENMETVKIPEFVERTVEADVVEYQCSICGHTQARRENEVTLTG